MENDIQSIKSDLQRLLDTRQREETTFTTSGAAVITCGETYGLDLTVRTYMVVFSRSSTGSLHMLYDTRTATPVFKVTLNNRVNALAVYSTPATALFVGGASLTLPHTRFQERLILQLTVHN